MKTGITRWRGSLLLRVHILDQTQPNCPRLNVGSALKPSARKVAIDTAENEP